MLISKVDSIHSYNLKSLKHITHPLDSCGGLKNGVSYDTFEKNNVSFGEKINYGELFYDIVKVSNDMLREGFVNDYLTYVSDNQIMSSMKKLRNYKIEKFNDVIFTKNDSYRGYLENLLKHSGIKNVMGLENFIKYSFKNPDVKKVFKDNSIQELEIYGYLNSKGNLAKYPQALLYIYQLEKSEKEPDYNILNEYCDVFSKLGLNNFNDFDKKFAHLKSDFNDFETMEDKFNLINYLDKTYEDRLNFISELLPLENAKGKKSPEYIYKNNNDVFDYLYMHQNDESKNDIKETVKIISESNQIKMSVMKKFEEQFNGFNSVEDKIKFYNYLRVNNISPSELNMLASNYIISDIDINTCVENKDVATEDLEILFDNNNQKTTDFYLKFKDSVNALYDKETKGTEDVECLINIINRFNIKNQESLLQFYNRATNNNKKNITAEELRNFADLFRYSDSQNLFEIAKQKHTTVEKLLQSEKALFEKYREGIKDFIEKDETGYLSDKNPIDIFKEYKNQIINSEHNISEILSNIVDFNIKNSDEYSYKISKINGLKQFFPQKDLLFKFIHKANIKFDNSPEENQHIENCRVILSKLYDENNEELTVRRIKNLNKTGFLKMSKSSLSQFISSFDNEEKLSEVVEIIADRKIKSLSKWRDFLKKHQGKEKYFDKNLVSHIKSSPQDMNFDNYVNSLSEFENRMEKMGFGFKITNSKIKNLDMNEIKNVQKMSDTDFYIALNKFLRAPEGKNFIYTLKNSMCKEPRIYSKNMVAQEIIYRQYEDEHEYSNIEKALKLRKKDLDLSSNGSYAEYIDAINKAIPDKFIDFINSKEWRDCFDNGEEFPNLSFHAVLRIIDRFALSNGRIDDLYKPQTVEMLKNVLKTLYTQLPVYMREGENDTQVLFFEYDNGKIKTMIKKNGSISTIVNINAV